MQLVEREEPLAALDRHLAAAAAAGRVVVLSGDAGVGKTALVTSWVRQRGGVRLHWGTCDGSATPCPLDPMLEAMPSLLAMPDLDDRFALLARVLADLRDGESSTPVLVLEDAHWADEATLDLLRAVGRRIGTTRALVVLTYRADEVAPGHPLAQLLGDLATSSLHRVEVAPLSPEGVRRLAGDASVDAALLHRRTGGNAFFVSEVLAARGEELPATVRDAVRARLARLTDGTRAALDVVAVFGRPAELDLLEALLGEGVSCLDEAVAAGVLVAQGDALRFRHELARETVDADIPPLRRLALHRQLVSVMRGPLATVDPARVAHHAEAARMGPLVVETAALAARRAAQFGGHREAVQQYQRALRFATGDDHRLPLLRGLGYELYLVGRTDEALSAFGDVLAIARQREDLLVMGTCHRWLSRLHWFAGRRAAAESHGLRALELLADAEPGFEPAMAFSNYAQLRMLADDRDGAVQWGQRAIAMGEAIGSEEVVVHALNNVGTARLRAGDGELGRQQLEESLERALAGNLHEHAARAYSNLGWQAVDDYALADAERWVGAGLEFCRDRDLDSWLLYLTGNRARLRLLLGRLDEAAEDAARVLASPHVAAVNRISPLLVAGLVCARRGASLAGELDEALAVAVPTEELQRVAPVAAARAEAAWLSGDVASMDESLDQAYALALRIGSPWCRGELAVWLQLAGRLTSPPGEVAMPYALQLSGEHAAAADAWAGLGCAYHSAMALATSSSPEDVRRAVVALDTLGAPAAAARAAQHVARLGGRTVRGPRPTTRSHPAGLTAREVEVLDQLLLGSSNADIAAALGVTTRTAEHHVAAVCAKLGARTRREAAESARARGMGSHPPQGG